MAKQKVEPTPSSSHVSRSAVLLCPQCKPHPFQDRTYGDKKRVMGKTAKDNVYRCTVCSKERSK